MTAPAKWPAALTDDASPAACELLAPILAIEPERVDWDRSEVRPSALEIRAVSDRAAPFVLTLHEDAVLHVSWGIGVRSQCIVGGLTHEHVGDDEELAAIVRSLSDFLRASVRHESENDEDGVAAERYVVHGERYERRYRDPRGAVTLATIEHEPWYGSSGYRSAAW